MTIRYWLATSATWIWFLFLILSCITTWAVTINHYKLKTETKDLQLEIVIEVLKSGSNFCTKIKAKNYMARVDMGTAASGCVK